MDDEIKDTPANYYFMVWKSRGMADKFAFVEKFHWDRNKCLDSETPENFGSLLPDSGHNYGFFTSSEMIYTYNKKKAFGKGKTEEAQQRLKDVGFTEIECPYGD